MQINPQLTPSSINQTTCLIPHRLPNEINFLIMSFLSLDMLAVVALTCKHWNVLTDEVLRSDEKKIVAIVEKMFNKRHFFRAHYFANKFFPNPHSIYQKITNKCFEGLKYHAWQCMNELQDGIKTLNLSQDCSNHRKFINSLVVNLILDDQEKTAFEVIELVSKQSRKLIEYPSSSAQDDNLNNESVKEHQLVLKSLNYLQEKKQVIPSLKLVGAYPRLYSAPALSQVFDKHFISEKDLNIASINQWIQTTSSSPFNVRDVIWQLTSYCIKNHKSILAIQLIDLLLQIKIDDSLKEEGQYNKLEFWQNAIKLLVYHTYDSSVLKIIRELQLSFKWSEEYQNNLIIICELIQETHPDEKYIYVKFLMDIFACKNAGDANQKLIETLRYRITKENDSFDISQRCIDKLNKYKKFDKARELVRNLKISSRHKEELQETIDFAYTIELSKAEEEQKGMKRKYEELSTSTAPAFQEEAYLQPEELFEDYFFTDSEDEE